MSTITADEGTAKVEARLRMADRLVKYERLALIIIFAAMVVVFSVLKPDTFATQANFSTLLGSQAVLVVVALAILFPLRCGDFDLSVAGTLAMSAMTVAVLNGEHGLPLLMCLPIAAVIGALIGAANAFFSLYFGTNPFIVTLGVGQVLVGLVTMISSGANVSGVSSSLSTWTVLKRPLGIPMDFFYVLVLCGLVWFFLERTVTGRRLLFVGSNRDVAKLSGIRVTKLRAGALITSGVLAAIAGIIMVGTQGSAGQANNYSSYLLQGFAAVYLGATAFTPGRFNAWGAMVAAYFLITGITGFQIFGAPPYVQDLFYGGALVLSISLAQLLHGRSEQSLS